jgi:hypothetical protein
MGQSLGMGPVVQAAGTGSAGSTGAEAETSDAPFLDAPDAALAAAPLVAASVAGVGFLFFTIDGEDQSSKI